MINYKITMVGHSGNLKTQVKEIVRPSENIKIIDRLASSDLADLFRNTKIFVLPSFYEGNPKLILEAMACGCLVVTTKVEGIRSLVSTEQVNFVKGFSQDALFFSINSSIANYNKSKSKIDNSLKWVKSNVSLNMVSKKYLKVITA